MDRETGPEPPQTGQATPAGETASAHDVPRAAQRDDMRPDDVRSRDMGRDYVHADEMHRDNVQDGLQPRTPQPVSAQPTRAVLASLSADPRVPIWIRRTVIALVVGIIVAIWLNWRWGVTAAAIVAIADTLYQSKAMSPIPADARATSAQRRTRRRLLTLRTAGYVSLHGRAIPGSESVIDHLVIGPAGVFALDSEYWDRRLPVRTTGGTSSGLLYHGPFSQSKRLAHARWEAAQAGRLVGAELQRSISVSPAMAIYGPTIPWGVATLRGVEVFSGKRVRKFFRSRNRATRGQHLDTAEVELIYAAAERALPPAG